MGTYRLGMNRKSVEWHRIVSNDIFTRCRSVSLNSELRPNTKISDEFELPCSSLMWKATRFSYRRWCRLSSQDRGTMTYLLRGISPNILLKNLGIKNEKLSQLENNGKCSPYYTKDREADLQFLNCHYACFIWFWGHSEDNTAHENLSASSISYGGLGPPNLPKRNKK